MSVKKDRGMGPSYKADGFHPSRRMRVRLGSPRWDVLPAALEMGREIEADAAKAKL